MADTEKGTVNTEEPDDQVSFDGRSGTVNLPAKSDGTGLSRNAFGRLQDDVAKKAEDAVGVVVTPWVRFVNLVHGRDFLAEFIATFMLVVMGNGAAAQVILGKTASPFNFGESLSINIGYGCGAALGVYIAGGITGAHMNPAVTLAMALRGRTPWKKVIPYWIAQMLGAFFSSVMLYAVYVDAVYAVHCPVHKAVNCTAGVWASYPQLYLTLGNGFLDQVFGTFLLVVGIFAICDPKNSEVITGLKPLPIGLLVTSIGLSFGLNAGYAINPARDFAPRLFTAIAGWGTDVFVCSTCGKIKHWWWVPVVAPMVGAALATFAYWLLIEAHHPKEQEEEAKKQQQMTDNGTTATSVSNKGHSPPPA